VKFRNDEGTLRIKNLCSNEEYVVEGEDVVGIVDGKSKGYHLGNSSIHLWHVSVDTAPPFVERLYQVLSREEKKRAGGFKFIDDAKGFILARGLLRVIIGMYLGIKPGAVNLHYTFYGKPFLPDSNLAFNISYSNKNIVLGFGKCGDIGLDIEYVNEVFEWNLIAETFFSWQEVTSIMTLPQHVQHEAFFTLWTMKEAIVKALGFGLTGIETITGKDFDELNIDSVWQIQFGEGVQGALATTEKWEHLKYYRLKE